MAYQEKTPKPRFEQLNLRREMEKYFQKWYWFFLCVAFCITGGYFFLKYTTPIYSAKASIIIKTEKGSSSESMIYGDLGLANGMGNNNLENEIGILKSKRLMREAVKSLNLNVQYFKKENVNSVELYEVLPFTLRIFKINEKELSRLGGASYKISSKDGKSFDVTNQATERVSTVTAGIPFDLPIGDVVLDLNSSGMTNYSEEVIVTFTPVEKVASHYLNNINLIQAEKNSSLVVLELKDPVKEKARDLLDQLVIEFNRNAIEDKNLIAGNTANFINERLAIINGELDSVETGKEIFKKQNLLTDIQAESQLYIQNASEFNQRRQEINTQLELSDAMIEYISSGSQTDFLPADLGINESSVNQQISEYNDLVLERNRILSGSSEKNPVVIRLNSQIDQIKGNVLQSLRTMKSNLLIGQEDINRQASSIGSKIFAVPSKEREYRGIERQQNIKETLYLFLLQKREENSLAMAVTEPKAKIVDRAYYLEGAVSPNPRSIYLGSFVLGFFIPFLFIYIGDVLDNKVRRRKDIEEISSEIPIVGILPKLSKKENLTIQQNDRSMLAESFRILMTNMQYLLVNSKDKSKALLLLVTSTVKGEGKTFTAVNLAVALAYTDKKVLLLGADLRSPQLHNFLPKLNCKIGLTDFLVSDDLILEDLVQKSSLHSNLDILPSGSIPPNPYELLKQNKMCEVVSQMEVLYDYIVVDSAPAMLVADTFLFAKYADLILYALRAGYTEKELVGFPLDAMQEGKLSNLGFVLNDVNISNLGYGNKYGYGYGSEKKSFFRRKSTM